MWQGVSLNKLVLENAGLTDLHTDIWTGLEDSLTKLILNGNSFQTIDSLVFQGLTKVEYLELDFCGIEHISALAMEGIESLQRLSLQGNALISMHPDMFGLTPLTRHFYIYFGYYDDVMHCFNDLCWFRKRIDNIEGLKCDNYDKSLVQFLQEQC